ncbi:hypothetical protein P7K49_033130 [Saguinus oedipus]|uniref:Basic proline-rich protein-like n=1 Tax=Saguinus oedipus TaxID=9490 RepID=A0ABQ9TR20_SAGOE|nr:hypothetical protein P7K49_033130 [Saguinus oedipus]
MEAKEGVPAGRRRVSVSGLGGRLSPPSEALVWVSRVCGGGRDREEILAGAPQSQQGETPPGPQTPPRAPGSWDAGDPARSWAAGPTPTALLQPLGGPGTAGARAPGPRAAGAIVPTAPGLSGPAPRPPAPAAPGPPPPTPVPPASVPAPPNAARSTHARLAAALAREKSSSAAARARGAPPPPWRRRGCGRRVRARAGLCCAALALWPGPLPPPPPLSQVRPPALATLRAQVRPAHLDRGAPLRPARTPPLHGAWKLRRRWRELAED